MIKTLVAVATLAAALAHPAAAITFPSLTTIYVGAGVFDDGGSASTGEATFVSCTNVSGVAVDIRVLMLGSTGFVEGQSTKSNLGHGQSAFFYTHTVQLVGGNNLETGLFIGTINIESTNSAVFCNARTIDAAAQSAAGTILPLVRVNPHPGTVE
jgi:hypothetical protein